MAETKAFTPLKLICGIIAVESDIFQLAQARLSELFGVVDSESTLFPFDSAGYYEKQMGSPLKRKFISFESLFPPDNLSGMKLKTNRLEDQIRKKTRSPTRVVNLDPGFLSASSLIMATAKDFAHRIPLKKGIYAHLELLFGKDEIRMLKWTYPDYRTHAYDSYFFKVRKIYLLQLKKSPLFLY